MEHCGSELLTARGFARASALSEEIRVIDFGALVRSGRVPNIEGFVLELLGVPDRDAPSARTAAFAGFFMMGRGCRGSDWDPRSRLTGSTTRTILLRMTGPIRPTPATPHAP
jgi:hypothetical protein